MKQHKNTVSIFALVLRNTLAWLAISVFISALFLAVKIFFQPYISYWIIAIPLMIYAIAYLGYLLTVVFIAKSHKRIND